MALAAIPPRRPARPARRGMPLGLVLLFFAVVCGYLVGTEHPRPVYRHDALDRALLYTHIVGASGVLTLGPFLLMRRSRRMAFLPLHHWVGRFYLGAVVATSVGGLGVTHIARGGRAAQLGLAVGFCAWLGTALLTYARVRAHDIPAHRRWAIRSYAFSLNIGLFGLWAALFGLALRPLGFGASAGLVAASWWSWVFDLLIAQLIIRGILHGPTRSLRRALTRR